MSTEVNDARADGPELVEPLPVDPGAGEADAGRVDTGDGRGDSRLF